MIFSTHELLGPVWLYDKTPRKLSVTELLKNARKKNCLKRYETLRMSYFTGAPHLEHAFSVIAFSVPQ